MSPATSCVKDNVSCRCRSCGVPSEIHVVASHDGQCVACFTERETRTLDFEEDAPARAA